MRNIPETTYSVATINVSYVTWFNPSDQRRYQAPPVCLVMASQMATEPLNRFSGGATPPKACWALSVD